MKASDDAKRWQQLKAIFAELVDLPPADRDERLTALAADRATCDEVLRMLTLHENLADFIEEPAIAAITPDDAMEDGRRFGRYRIIRELGHGGMGAVFLASRDDADFDQLVALKIIRQSVADSRVKRRFRREMQILAALSHPYIARLIDGDVTEKGELFLVMEFVEGIDIKSYVAAKELSIDETLRLFTKVCEAVSAAHRQLVVHLDLKPSNILITPDGLPKLLDFGLSRILAEESLEASAATTEFRAFTPGYSAPEQILGKPVSVTADVYSLGVVLFELLTGSRPFRLDGQGLDEILATLAKGPPAAPSSIGRAGAARSSTEEKEIERDFRRIDRDLDTVVLKALSFDVAERYRQVDDLAADIDLFRAGRPVKARPASYLHRIRKFVRRNRIAVAAAIIITLTVLTGTLITVQQIRATINERDRAERRFNDLRKLSSSLLFDITPRIERLEGSIEARTIVVTNALEFLDSLATEASDDSELQRELAGAYVQIGRIQGDTGRPNLNDFPGALTSLNKAVAILDRFPADTAAARQKALALRIAARARPTDVVASVRDAEQAIAIYDSLLLDNKDDVDSLLDRIETLTELAQIHTSNTAFEPALTVLDRTFPALDQVPLGLRRREELLVFASTQRAFALSWQNRQAEAEQVMSRAITEAESLAGRFPGDVRIEQLKWEAYFRASAIYETIRDELSRDFALKCVELKQAAVNIDRQDVQARHNLARSLSRVALAQANLGKLTDAVKYLDLAEKELIRLRDSHPANMSYLVDLASLYYRRGQLFKKNGRAGEAWPPTIAARDLYQHILTLDPVNLNARRHVALSEKHLGDLSQQLRAGGEANRHYSISLDIFRQIEAEGRLPAYDRKLLTELTARMTQSGR